MDLASRFDHSLGTTWGSRDPYMDTVLFF